MNQKAFIKVDKATFYDFVSKHDDERFEYEDGYIVQQMTGGTRKHGRLAVRFLDALRAGLDPSQFEVLPDRGVETVTTIRYPDVVVEPAAEIDTSLATLRPALIVEVLSPSSTARDLEHKPVEYTALASLVAYIVASQDDVACLMWVRGPSGEFAAEPIEVAGADATLRIPELNMSLSLSDIYRGIDLSPRED